MKILQSAKKRMNFLVCLQINFNNFNDMRTFQFVDKSYQWYSSEYVNKKPEILTYILVVVAYRYLYAT